MIELRHTRGKSTLRRSDSAGHGLRRPGRGEIGDGRHEASRTVATHAGTATGMDTVQYMILVWIQSSSWLPPAPCTRTRHVAQEYSINAVQLPPLYPACAHTVRSGRFSTRTAELLPLSSRVAPFRVPFQIQTYSRDRALSTAALPSLPLPSRFSRALSFPHLSAPHAFSLRS